MSTMIVYCGLDCASCEAYKVTLANDQEAMQQLVAKWRQEYNSPDMPLEAVICDGCRGPRLGGYCSECPIRACATERGFQTCAECPEYGCEKLENFFKMAPHARANLEALRA